MLYSATRMSGLPVDCNNMAGVFACAEVNAVCMGRQKEWRERLVYTNFLYGLPVLAILFTRNLWWRQSLRVSEIVAVTNFVLVAIVSGLYHACDTADGAVLCYQKCFMPGDQLRFADFIASTLAAHTTTLIDWEPAHPLGQTYVLLSYLLMPFLSLFVIPHYNGLLYAVILVGALNVLMRGLVPSGFKTMTPPNLGKLEQQQQTRLPLNRWWWVWATAGAAAIVMAIILQYTEELGSTYASTHSVWHVLGGVAAMFGCLIFMRKANEDDGNKKELPSVPGRLMSIYQSNGNAVEGYTQLLQGLLADEK